MFLRMNWRRKPYFEKGEANLSARVRNLNLYYLEALRGFSKYLNEIGPPQKKLKILDLGSKDFAYALALRQWVEEFFEFESAQIWGLELKPWVYYWDLYSRYQVAEYYSKVASTETIQVRYLEGDWLRMEKRENAVDLVTCFFPHLYPDLQRRSRLSMKAFQPAEFYRRAFEACEQAVIFFHQGRGELEDSVALIKKIGRGRMQILPAVPKSPFLQKKWTTERLLWLKS